MLLDGIRMYQMDLDGIELYMIVQHCIRLYKQVIAAQNTIERL